MEADLTIVGLGPGGAGTMTVAALELLKRAPRVIIRTGKHPAVEELGKIGVRFSTLDRFYEQFSDFGEVYEHITSAVMEEARAGPVVYAVPGHPLVGEESVAKLIVSAERAGLSYKILPAMSFLDPVLAVLRIDISDGLKIIDGMGLIEGAGRPECLPDPMVANLVMQVYSPMVASEVKLSLMDFYPDEYRVTVIRAAGIPGEERKEEIPLFELDRLNWVDHLTCIYIPPHHDTKVMVSRFSLDRLVDILDGLRDINGCPWDKEQTHFTLKKYLLEETYEVLDAIDEGNMYKVCEELGDLLLQIAFHAQIARECGFFDMNDVVASISEKLVRRHPHVFGATTARTSAEVSANWEEIKKGELEEKGETRQSLLDGIPQSMPALMKADKIQRKAAKVGFDWPDYSGALDKVTEETAEIKQAITEDNPGRVQDEIGDLLFASVNLARLLKVNPEEALIMAVRKFTERFKYMESLAAQTRSNLKEMDLNALDRLWEEAKNRLNSKKT